ncbi:hypothetical protein [Kitasatospora sp. NPDC017646]|uniref:hypothetical protein n=1 Tax=Kitasatospora sp. NPDC017646 TaxID=3364024 RepID=UPI00379289C7
MPAGVDLRDDLDAYGPSEPVGADRILPALPTTVSAYRSRERGERGGERANGTPPR